MVGLNGLRFLFQSQKFCDFWRRYVGSEESLGLVTITKNIFDNQKQNRVVIARITEQAGILQPGEII